MLTNQCMHCNPDQKRDCEQCSIYQSKRYKRGQVYKIYWTKEFSDLWDIKPYIYAVYDGEVDLDINGWSIRCHKFIEHREDKSTRVLHLNVNGDVAQAIIMTSTRVTIE